jgi:hypothetical protein
MEIKGKATVKYNNGASISPKGKLTVSDTGSICSIEGGGKIDFDNINVDNFTYKGKVNCVGINAKEYIDISGAVSAKVIEAGTYVSIIFSNNISVGDVKASNVEVKPIDEKKLNAFSEFLSKIVHITVDKKDDIRAKFKNIQASDVKLTDCDADVVVCDKIKLAGKCKIKKLICSGDVKIVGKEVIIKTQETK